MNENAIAKPDTFPSVDALKSLINRAEKGDTKAAGELRQLVKAAPELASILGGDLTEQLDSKIVGDAVGKNLAFKEGIRQKMLSLRSELAGTSPPPLERLLVERIVTCWLQLHVAELKWQSAGKMTLAQADYLQRCLDRAHNRYLTAVKTLAVVRRLLRPSVQVNIAKQQVNVSH